jgi:acyl-coenzyme A thioesterase PaaI-like protein
MSGTWTVGSGSMAEEREVQLHEALVGREGELRALVDSVRRLMVASVTTTAGLSALEEAAAGIDAISELLEVDVPDKPFPRFVGRDPSVPAEGPEIERAMPFDPVVGSYNPVALPVKLEIDPPRALGRATFTIPYEGAPGCVHGSAIASAFDIVLTAANMLAGAAGPTVRLSLRFRRPTLIGTEAVFEAWVRSRTDRRVQTEGRLLQDGIVTVEAEGEFAALDMERIASLHLR